MQEAITRFSKELLDRLDPNAIPHHIAIIPDGNRRWARAHGLFEFLGHSKGAEVLIDTVSAAQELGIKAITFYSFSTENWQRTTDEIQGLMAILVAMLEKETPRMIKEGVRFETIGDLTPFSKEVNEALQNTKRATKDQTKIDLILALNYGGRNEICRAVRQMAIDFAEEKINEIDETILSSYLDTAQWPDPDLVIRTSGEMRISNFLLWQTSYAEMIALPTYWPDFTADTLLESILTYQKRQRRLGR